MLVSRLSSVCSFSSSQMTRQGRNYRTPMAGYTLSPSERGEVCNLPFKHPPVPSPPSPRGSFQLVHKSEVTDSSKSGPINHSGGAAAAGKARPRRCRVNRRSPRCSSALPCRPQASLVLGTTFNTEPTPATRAICDFRIMPERSNLGA